ncbi:MAG: DctP family TRAP transporter solute-binding subunit [Oscillibacter sp.]|nr:DctP family TRAP transporter solute-binding subunit [Oscillibacter sp.]
MKKFLALTLALMMTLTLVACGGSGSSSSSGSTTPAASGSSSTPAASGSGETSFPSMTLKIALSATDTSTWADGLRYFDQLVQEATGGAVKCEIYASDQLTAGNQTEGIQAVIDGTTDMSVHSNIIYSNFDQRFNVVSLPFLFGTTDDADKVLDGAGGEALNKVAEGMGLHLVGIMENGFRHVTNNVHPIEKMADMKGLKIRVAGSQLLNRMYELWGANYTNANWSEVFTGLQTGTYEGQENPLPTADSASIAEVTKYLTYWTGTYDCLFFTINQELYDSMSPELQAIIDDAGAQAATYQRGINREQDEEIMARWEKDYGIQITRLSDEAAEEFRQTALPCYDEFRATITDEVMAAFGL